MRRAAAGSSGLRADGQLLSCNGSVVWQDAPLHFAVRSREMSSVVGATLGVGGVLVGVIVGFSLATALFRGYVRQFEELRQPTPIARRPRRRLLLPYRATPPPTHPTERPHCQNGARAEASASRGHERATGAEREPRRPMTSPCRGTSSSSCTRSWRASRCLSGATRCAWSAGPIGSHTETVTTCHRCVGQRWVCEAHPDRPWPHEDCAGPGEPCPLCNAGEPLRDPPGFVSIVRVEDGDE